MPHEHSSGQPIRHSAHQKSSKKDADFLYPELLGQWQDFKFPVEEFLQLSITKQHVAEAERASSSAHRASSATTDPIRPSSTRDLELEIRLTEAQNPKAGSYSWLVNYTANQLGVPISTDKNHS